MTLPYAPRVAKLTITTTISGPRNKGINHNIAGPSSSSPARRLSLVPAAACPCDEDISGSIPSSYQTGETLIRCGRTAGVVVPPVRLYRRCGCTAGAVVPPVRLYRRCGCTAGAVVPLVWGAQESKTALPGSHRTATSEPEANPDPSTSLFCSTTCISVPSSSLTVVRVLSPR